ncbi:MAG: CoA pyrophosphatase [Bacteroidales bacterium]|nr:CoA pyrophosphatase [Bacteroidales bacterium]MCF8333219.1 CoA pyrophosphatase [Bacteroidales bacterium]
MSGSKNLLIEQLRETLNKTLPGNAAHKLLEPQTRRRYDKHTPLVHPRKSSIMIIIFPSGDFFSTYTILRPKYDGIHSDQIGFPGGQKEWQDDNLLDTAIRETQEEIAVTIDKNEVLGKLTDIYIPPSNFMVAPYIAFRESKPSTERQPSEVEKIIEVNLREIIAPDAIVSRSLYVEHYGEVHVPCFMAGEYVIWGATAMIMSELREVLRKIFAAG